MRIELFKLILYLFCPFSALNALKKRDETEKLVGINLFCIKYLSRHNIHLIKIGSARKNSTEWISSLECIISLHRILL